MVQAWKCDRAVCGYVWYTGSDEPPARCAKCKRKGWNAGSVPAQAASQAERNKVRKALEKAAPLMQEILEPVRALVDSVVTCRRCDEMVERDKKNPAFWYCTRCRRQLDTTEVRQ